MLTRLRLKNAATRLRLKNKAAADLPAPEKIPVLIPPKSLEAIQGEGMYEFVEAIDVPADGTGGTYTADYFSSLLDYMKQYPMAGSKDGHEVPNNDFYTIGGELQMRNETDGVCYLRVLVPQEGWNSSNKALISSLKVGIPELSIIADVEPTRGNDGKVYFTKELGRPRNDIVPEGAMDQTIGNSVDEKEVMALIEQGAIDMDSESDVLVKNGKVYRQHAVKLQSTADQGFATRVLQAIAKKTKNTKEKNGMNKDELIAALKAAVANNQITLEEIAASVGLENKLRNLDEEAKTGEQLKEAEALVDAIEEVLGLPEDTPIKEVIAATEAALEELEKAEESTVEVAVNELVGGKTQKNANGEDEDNPQFLYAMEKLKAEKLRLKQQNKKLRGKELNSAIESLKDDPIMVSLRSKAADARVNAQDGKDDKPGSVNIREV